MDLQPRCNLVKLGREYGRDGVTIGKRRELAGFGAVTIVRRDLGNLKHESACAIAPV